MLFDKPPGEWNITTLGEVCSQGGGGIQTGPFGSQLHASDYVDEGIPSIMPANIGDNRISEEGIARITKEDADRLSKYLVQDGDIVYSRRGDVEKCALVRKHEDGWLCGTGCLRVRPGNGIVDPLFCSYFLSHPESREWISRHAVGATMPNLNTQILSEVPFLLPVWTEQKAIAHVLGTLDDKIELNRRTNETLEGIAKALFKSWFVDFDPVRAKAEGRPTGLPDEISDLFPDSLEESELGVIPSGWSCSSVYDLADYINGASHSSKTLNDNHLGHPVIKINELKNGFTGQTKYWNAVYKEKHLVASGDILFSWSGNPDTSIGTFVWSKQDGLLNQHIFKVVPRNSKRRSFVLSMLKSNQETFADIARDKQTTGLGHVTVKDLKEMLCPIASDAVMTTFASLVDDILERCQNLVLQIDVLEDLRDALLPRLISGELRVPDAEKMLEEVGV